MDGNNSFIVQWKFGLPVLFWILILVYSIAVIIYALHFGGYGFSAKTDAWGQFGDFLGGVVNPTASLITVLILVVTFKQTLSEQERQFKLARESKDFDVCATLITFYRNSGHRCMELAVELKKESFKFEDSNLQEKHDDVNKSKHDKLVIDAEKYFSMANDLNHIITQAHNALLIKYPKL